MTLRLSSVEYGAILLSVLFAGLIAQVGLGQPVMVPTLALALLVMVAWVAWADVVAFVIPDGPLICLATLAVAERLIDGIDGLDRTVFDLAIDVVFCGGALWFVRETFYRIRGYDGLGFGDVKLAAVGGLLVGHAGFAWAVLLASVFGLLVVGAARLLAPQRPLNKLPFGALLAPACWLLWIFNGGVVT